GLRTKSVSEEMLFLVLERVTERSAEARGMVPGELHLIVYQIEIDFRTDKDGARQVKLHPTSKMSHEVVAADEVGKTGKLVALQKGRVKTNALNSNSCLQVQLRPFAQGRTVDAAKIVKEWPERLKALIQILACSPRCIKARAKVVVKEEIHAEVEIRPAADRRYLGIRGRCGKTRSPEPNIKLLCLCRASQQKKQTKRRNVQR